MLCFPKLGQLWEQTTFDFFPGERSVRLFAAVLTRLQGRIPGAFLRTVSRRCYNVRLKSGNASNSVAIPNVKRNSRSKRMATKPPSLSRISLNPCTA